jgi:anaerobic magnesium-protoporphyrin IX monomethyl ester cyclase
MAKILFLNSPHKFRFSRSSRWSEKTKTGTLYYPIWLAYACGYAEKEGHEGILLDAIAKSWDFDQTIREIIKISPDLLIVDSTTPSVCSDARFVERLKKKAKMKVVFVGTHPSALPKETLEKFKQIDFVAIGEYDATIPDLANNLSRPERVAGIAYRKGGKAIVTKPRQPISNLDDLPFVSKVYKKFLNVNDYSYSLAIHPMMQIMTSRGCPNMCTFCSWPQTFMGRNFRARSPENVVAEMEYIKKEIPEIKEVFIEDDTFTTNRSRVSEICRLIVKKKLHMTWSANVRTDLSIDILRQMKAAGCRLLVVGYESGNQQILNNIRKGITLEQAENFTKNAKRAGLRIFGCFMIGLPGDTKETIMQTFRFAQKLNPDMAFFQQAVPFPGTELYRWSKSKGCLMTEDYDKWLDSNGQLDFLLNYDGLSSEDIKKLRSDLTLKFYTSPAYLFYTLRRNAHPLEMTRLIKTTKNYMMFLAKRRSKK